MIDVTVLEIVTALFAATGTLLGSFAVYRRGESDGKAKAAQAQADAAVLLSRQQGEFQTALMTRVAALEAELARERHATIEEVRAERERCDREITRLECLIAKLRRGSDSPVRRSDPT